MDELIDLKKSSYIFVHYVNQPLDGGNLRASPIDTRF